MNAQIIIGIIIACASIAAAVIGATWKLSTLISSGNSALLSKIAELSEVEAVQNTRLNEVVMPALEEHEERLSSQEQRILAVETGEHLSAWSKALLDLLRGQATSAGD